MPITELPTTAPTSLGPDKIDKRVYAGEAYRIQAFLVNKIRQYLIDIGGEVGLSDGSTPGSLVARVAALEAGGGGGGGGPATAIRETSGPTTLSIAAVADGGVLVRSGTSVVSKAIGSAANTVAAGNDARFLPQASTIYFSPGNPSPAPGVITTWSAVASAITTARAAGVQPRVIIDGANVGYTVDVPAGTYDWERVTFESDYNTLNFKTGAVVSPFTGVYFKNTQLTTDAVAGTPAFTAYLNPQTSVVTFDGGGMYDGGPGFIPVLRSAAGTGGLYINIYNAGCFYQSGGTASAVLDANGGRIYLYLDTNAYIENRTISSSDAGSRIDLLYISASSDPAATRSTAAFQTSHPLWTAGTITTSRTAEAGKVVVTPSGGITETDVQSALVGLDARGIAKGVLVYFTPSHPSPPPGVCTTWAQVQALLDAAGGRQKEVRINSSYVSSIINIPAGTYNWDYLTLTGDGCGVRLAQGVTISAFYNLMLDRVTLSTEATSGASPLTSYGTAGTYQRIFLRNASVLRDRGAGRIPLINCAAGVGGVYAVLTDSSYVLAGTVPVISVSGGSLILECHDIAGVDNDAVSSTNAGSTCTINAAPGYAYTTPTPMLPSSRPAYTAGAFTFTLMHKAASMAFTPSGDIAASDVQAALAELDTEKAAVSGGQLGGTGAAPDVRGLRETSGPTLLTIGAITDGQVLKRSGSTIVGVGGGPYELLWKWNQTDLTEFDQVGDGSHAYTVTTWGARNSTDDPTPAIRMDSPATSGGFSALLVKTALLPAFTDPTKLLIVARMQNSTTLGTQDPLLIPYYESTTYLTALARKTSGASPPQYLWCLREGSTTYSDKTSISVPSSLANNADGAFFSCEFILSPASGAQKPWIAAQQNRFYPQTFAQTIPQARSAYAAGWTGLGSYAPRIGFGVRTYGMAAAPGNCISDIAIYRVT